MNAQFILFILYCMMTKEQHINYWKETALDDWDTAMYLVNGARNAMALFMFHLVIEKLLNAHWVKSNVNNVPPYSHDLEYIFAQTDLVLDIHTVDYVNVVS